MTATPTLAVERLALHVPSMSEADARLLAGQVAQALRRWPAAPGPGRVEAVTAHVEVGASRDTAALAERIAEAVLDAVLRELP